MSLPGAGVSLLLLGVALLGPSCGAAYDHVAGDGTVFHVGEGNGFAVRWVLLVLVLQPGMLTLIVILTPARRLWRRLRDLGGWIWTLLPVYLGLLWLVFPGLRTPSQQATLDVYRHELATAQRTGAALQQRVKDAVEPALERARGRHEALVARYPEAPVDAAGQLEVAAAATEIERLDRLRDRLAAAVRDLQSLEHAIVLAPRAMPAWAKTTRRARELLDAPESSL